VDKQSKLLTKQNWCRSVLSYFTKRDIGEKQQLQKLTCIIKVVNKYNSHGERCLNVSRLFLSVAVSVTAIESPVSWWAAVRSLTRSVVSGGGHPLLRRFVQQRP
jgi:hypothetical protein